MRTTTLLLLMAILVLSGCASMSKDECLMADWQTIGFEDGAAGRSAAQIGERRQACAKHGVAPDMAAYQTGYQNGLQSYCTYGRGHDSAVGGYSPQQICPTDTEYHSGYQEGLEKFCSYNSGYEYGLSGANYRRTCPASMEDAFLNGYDAGFEIHNLESALYNLEAELHDIDAAREYNEEHQEDLKQELILNQDLTAEDRTRILLDIDDLREEDDDLEERKDALLVEIGDLRAQLRDMGVEI